jgi:hypothetical protein
MQQACSYVTSRKTSYQGFRLYQDSPFIAVIVSHDYCFLEVVTKLNVNQNTFGRLYPVFFHSLCLSMLFLGYWKMCRHNNRLKMIQILKNVDLQNRLISLVITEKDGTYIGWISIHCKRKYHKLNGTEV